MKINVNNEYGTLKAVILAAVDNFFEAEIINDTQAIFYGTEDTPQLALMKRQQKAFADALTKFGVNVIWAKSIAGAVEQTHARDVSFAIGNNFFVASLKDPVRQREVAGLEPIIAQIESPIFRGLSGVIEGGDVLVDGKKVFVGLSQRTDETGVASLSDTLSGDGYQVVPIELKEGYLHLDTVFNIFAPNSALIYPDAIIESSLNIIESEYTLIEVDKKEQFSLGTNTFCLSPDTLVCDPNNENVLRRLVDFGQNVLEVDYSEIAKTGGLFRCGTCPLVRE